MTPKLMPTLILATYLAACASTPSDDPAVGERLAPLLDGMGRHHHTITTSVPRAQRFFNQGLTLAYGFNHAEAARSFREASRLDPSCAMCAWGEALVLGPNYNATMDEAAVAPAWEAISRAQRLATDGPEAEHAYIEALAARYVPEPVDDRSALDEAYAAAMSDLAARYPDDTDAATLAAEAAMVLHPWDLWADGEPRPWTPGIVSRLEAVLARNPDHPGANHLYIHAVEASPNPGRAEAAADRLGDLVPGAGHLVHMPSHIYLRVGRYHDASFANQRAIAADVAYAAQCHAQGLYPLAYMPHNRHFLWAAATMEGRGEVAIRAATEMAERIDAEAMRLPGMGTLQHFMATPLYAWVRFGKWDEILAAPRPEDDLIYPIGVWHYARGLALVAANELDEAAAELASLRRVAADPGLAEVTIWDINGSVDLLAIAALHLAGKLAEARGDHAVAITHLERGVELEDALNYDEPEAWHLPLRQVLGAVLLAAGDAAQAEAVFRADLDEHPENGWALYGLWQSLLAQGRDDEARYARTRFDAAWSLADIDLDGAQVL